MAADHGIKPLFVNKGNSKTLLNEFFFYVFSKVLSLQNIRNITATTLTDVTELFLNSIYQALPYSKSGHQIP